MFVFTANTSNFSISLKGKRLYINLHYFSPWGQNSFSTMSLIICCDGEPSNVFLNNEMTAHVSNSGLARLVSRLGKDHVNQFSLLGIKGFTGCAAPGTINHEFASSDIEHTEGNSTRV